MIIPDYECEIEGKSINFYHNKKTHQYDILIDGEKYRVTKARGEAIIKFLKLIL